MARTGRPTDDPKTQTLHLRLSDADMARLEYCVKVTGKPRAEIIRLGIREMYDRLKVK